MLNYCTLSFVLLHVTWITAEIAFPPEYSKTFVAEKEFLAKQKRVYDVIFHFKQPAVRADLYENGQQWSVSSNKDKFSNQKAVQAFLSRYTSGGFLSNNDLYSLYHSEHNDQVLALYRLMLYAKDFDTFYRSSLLYRDRMNNELFVEAFYLAVYSRPDTVYVRVPPIYEVLPHFFYSAEVIERARRFKEFGMLEKNASYTILNNRSTKPTDRDDDEYRVAYFTEDVALGNYHYLLFKQFPHFFDSEEFNLPRYLRGQEYVICNLLLYNQYLYHRTSNYLGEVEAEDYDHSRAFRVGYQPGKAYSNGVPFPARSWNSYLDESKYELIREFEEYESRILDAIDSGVGYSKNGKTFDMYAAEGHDALCDMLQGNDDSNQRRYGSLNKLGRLIFGSGYRSKVSATFRPSVLENDFTCIQDPAFWRIFKRVYRLYARYVKNLKPYKPEEIQFPGLKFKSVEVDKLVTYFEDSDILISKGLAINYDMDESYSVKVRQPRINGKPFNVNFVVTADKPATVYVKIAMGPKYDLDTNEELDFSERASKFYLLDQFFYNVVTGDNKIVRSSRDFFFTDDDFTPSDVFYEKVKNALAGKETLKLKKHLLAVPRRFILPKGKAEGMPFQFFFYVSPFAGKPFDYTSRMFGNMKMDLHPYNYPFDRPFRDADFNATNFYWKDVMIYHEDGKDGSRGRSNARSSAGSSAGEL